MDKKIKIFLRILKELGIYKIWLGDRKQELVRKNVVPDFKMIFLVLEDYSSLNDIVDKSFIWSATKHENFWNSVYNAWESYYTLDGIFNDYKLLCDLKKKIDKLKEEYL